MQKRKLLGYDLVDDIFDQVVIDYAGTLFAYIWRSTLVKAPAVVGISSDKCEITLKLLISY